MNAVELIQSLIEQTEELQYGQDEKLDAIRRRGELVIRKLFGEDSYYLTDLQNLRFCPVMVSLDEDNSAFRSAFAVDKPRLVNLFETMMEDLQLSNQRNARDDIPSISDTPTNNRIFVVHGHDDEMKQSVARTLEKLELEPIILHEQPDQSRTIIEKFLDNADGTSFAIVLLSPDDMAFQRNEPPDKARPRARQNVILELGFFIGRLGRERVVAIYREAGNFELPSDISGMLYKRYDGDSGNWRSELVKELKACGYDVDANKFY